MERTETLAHGKSCLSTEIAAPVAAVQCPTPQLRNVMDYLPEDQKGQGRSAMRAAWRLDAETSLVVEETGRVSGAKIPFVRGQLMEGMEECFTINWFDIHLRCIAAWPRPM
jgi:hypothetical protein